MVGYIIKQKNQVTADMWSACLCDEETARQSLDGIQVLLKFEAQDTPAVFAGETILTKQEARQAMQGQEWNHD